MCVLEGRAFTLTLSCRCACVVPTTQYGEPRPVPTVCEVVACSKVRRATALYAATATLAALRTALHPGRSAAAWQRTVKVDVRNPGCLLLLFGFFGYGSCCISCVCILVQDLHIPHEPVHCA